MPSLDNEDDATVDGKMNGACYACGQSYCGACNHGGLSEQDYIVAVKWYRCEQSKVMQVCSTTSVSCTAKVKVFHKTLLKQ